MWQTPPRLFQTSRVGVWVGVEGSIPSAENRLTRPNPPDPPDLAQPRPTSPDLARPRPTSPNLATVALKALRFMFDKWPRLVAEYKPTFGALPRAARRRCPSELLPRALSAPPPRRRLQQVPQRLQPLGVRDRDMRGWEPAVRRL